MKVLTLDEFMKETEQGRSGSEDFGAVVDRVEKYHGDIMWMIRDIVNELFEEKERISAVDVYDRLDEYGAVGFDRRYIGVALGDMKRHGEIVNVGITRNPRRHGSKIEVFERAEFVSADVIAKVRGVKV